MNRACSAMAWFSASPICAFSAPRYRPSSQNSTPPSALASSVSCSYTSRSALRWRAPRCRCTLPLKLEAPSRDRSASSDSMCTVSGFSGSAPGSEAGACGNARGPPHCSHWVANSGRGGGREAERHQERAPPAARPQPVSRVALHRRDLAGVRVHNRVVSVGLGVLFRIAWTSTGPFSTGEPVDAGALSCPTDPGRRASGAGSRPRASGNPERWKIAQNAPALQRDASTRSASASMCRGRSLRAGM